MRTPHGSGPGPGVGQLDRGHAQHFLRLPPEPPEDRPHELVQDLSARGSIVRQQVPEGVGRLSTQCRTGVPPSPLPSPPLPGPPLDSRLPAVLQAPRHQHGYLRAGPPHTQMVPQDAAWARRGPTRTLPRHRRQETSRLQNQVRGHHERKRRAIALADMDRGHRMGWRPHPQSLLCSGPPLLGARGPAKTSGFACWGPGPLPSRSRPREPATLRRVPPLRQGTRDGNTAGAPFGALHKTRGVTGQRSLEAHFWGDDRDLQEEAVERAVDAFLLKTFQVPESRAPADPPGGGASAAGSGS